MRSEDSDQNDSVPEGSEVEDASPTPAEIEGSEGADSGGGSDRELETELNALNERYLRLAAEYDNYRKRTDRERLESRDRSQGQIVEKLLETLDDLQRVAALDAEGTTTEAVLEGIRLVERKLVRALESEGLEPLDSRGKTFDPAIHEALMTATTEDSTEDDTVGEVFQTGYRFRGTLIRPARVQVRKHEG